MELVSKMPKIEENNTEFIQESIVKIVKADESAEEEFIEIVELGDEDDNQQNKNNINNERETHSSNIVNNCDNSENETDTNNDDNTDDIDTPKSVKNRLAQGCECTRMCLNNLDIDEVYRHRLNIAELTKNELEMYLMGIIMASSLQLVVINKNSNNIERQRRHRRCYMYRGKKVCQKAFLYLENVSLYQMKKIRNHVFNHGIQPRRHGNVGKKAHNAFSLDVYRNVESSVKKYLKNYINDLTKTQSIRGITRADIYNWYKNNSSDEKPDDKLMGYSAFRCFMKKQFPHIKFIRTDVQHTNTNHQNSNNNSKHLLATNHLENGLKIKRKKNSQTTEKT